MAVQQAPAGTVHPSADVVSKAFIHQYYLILHQSPEHVHQFYQEISKLGRPEADGLMGITSTMKGINEKILSVDYGEYRAEIVTVDAQESYNGGVLVLVTGYLTGRDNARRRFTQSFFLAPQEKGFFVLNDIFRYVEEPLLLDANPVAVNDAEAPSTVEQDDPQDQQNDFPEKTQVSLDEVDQEEIAQEEVRNSSEIGDGPLMAEKIPVSEVVDELPVDLERTAKPDAEYEDVPKKSYAWIVKVTKEGPVQGQQQLTTSSPPVFTLEIKDSSTKVTGRRNSQESEPADGHSIYLKGLPVSVTYPQIEREFSRFGPIKQGGIQIKNQRGFVFSFVEFEEPSAAVNAIEASPIKIGGRQVVVEPKKSTIRVNTQDGFPSGRPTRFRNYGPQERVNYGGSGGYDRGEMNIRSEFRNRSSGREGEYYHRSDRGYYRAQQPRRSFNGRDQPMIIAP